jgi:hypothetical protein
MDNGLKSNSKLNYVSSNDFAENASKKSLGDHDTCFSVTSKY